MKTLSVDLLAEQTEKQMRADIASARIGGAAVYVCQEREDGGRIEYSAAFGKRNTDTGEDMTADTVFRLASMTKPVTVTALLLLLERGLLSLSDPALGAGCYGWSGAYGTHFWIDPADRLFAIYMKNSLFDGGANAGTARAFERCVAASLVG